MACRGITSSYTKYSGQHHRKDVQGQAIDRIGNIMSREGIKPLTTLYDHSPIGPISLIPLSGAREAHYRYLRTVTD